MSSTSGNEFDSRNEELQREKLLLEIRELKHRWWQKPSYISALVPAFLGILTVSVGYTTGYFNALGERLAAQRQVLERDVSDFRHQREQVDAQLKQLSGERDRISAENGRLNSETNRLRAEERELLHTKDSLETRLALAPLEADINRVVDLTSKSFNVTDVQKIIEVSLGTKLHPEIEQALTRIAKSLSVRDRFQSRRLVLVRSAIKERANPKAQILLKEVVTISERKD